MNRRFNARECEVKSITREEADDFLIVNHRQSAIANDSAAVSLGIFYEKELLGVAQFCYPRTSEKKRKYTCELLRLAFQEHTRINGGASKLVSYYKREYKPADIFTYQDMTGEQTDVYKHCGFVLASQSKTKQYLVAPGKTRENGNRKEVLGMPYAVRYGPDRILGTTLGEVTDPKTGKRKTNQQIFIEDLGWHVEETPGDRVWEWFDKERTYYVYKITAEDSDKYYFGVSHIKKQNASVKECEQDNYWGSGSEKYKNWRKKHRKTLSKEVLELFSSKAEAFNAEKELIANKWAEDPFCLNSRAGGAAQAPVNKTVKLASCKTHGLVKHRNNVCLRCAAQKRFSVEHCEHHGTTTFEHKKCCRCRHQLFFSKDFCNIHAETSFNRGKCIKCSREQGQKYDFCEKHKYTKFNKNGCIFCFSEELITEQTCAIHGLTKFQANVCRKCVTAATNVVKECEKHGKTVFNGNNCRKCYAEKAVSVKECSYHGLGAHLGEHCYSCLAQKSRSVKKCQIHGEVSFVKDKCSFCIMRDTLNEKECAIHGLTMHIHHSCCLCTSAKVFSEQNCKIHGETKFVGKLCSKCIHEKSFSIQNCAIHGETKFKGKVCWKCAKSKSYSTKYCITHGMSTFQGEKCISCSRIDLFTEKNCSIHGLVKHQGVTCTICISEKSLSIKHCLIHGESKHRNDSCLKCVGKLRAHRRFHKDKSFADCIHCE